MVSNKTSIYRKIVFEILIILLSMLVIIPFYSVLVNSLKPSNEAASLNISLPSRIEFQNYIEVYKLGKIPLAFKNSCIVTLSSVFLTILLSSAAAFIIQRNRGKVSRAIEILVLIGLIIPPCMVPIFYVLKLLGLLGEYWGIIFVYIATLSPLAIYMYFQYIKTISKEFDEAAVIDGCGQIQLFYRIIFPMLLPVTVTVLVFNFIMIWNDFVLPIYFLSRGNKVTLPLTIYYFYGQYRLRWNLVFADIILASLPLIAIYVSAQRYVISGLTAGAIKG